MARFHLSSDLLYDRGQFRISSLDGKSVHGLNNSNPRIQHGGGVAKEKGEVGERDLPYQRSQNGRLEVAAIRKTLPLIARGLSS